MREEVIENKHPHGMNITKVKHPNKKTTHTRTQNKPALFLCEMFVKLERSLRITTQNKDQIQPLTHTMGVAINNNEHQNYSKMQ